MELQTLELTVTWEMSLKLNIQFVCSATIVLATLLFLATVHHELYVRVGGTHLCPHSLSLLWHVVDISFRRFREGNYTKI